MVLKYTSIKPGNCYSVIHTSVILRTIKHAQSFSDLYKTYSWIWYIILCVPLEESIIFQTVLKSISVLQLTLRPQALVFCFSLLYCLFVYDLRLSITSLVYSKFSLSKSKSSCHKDGCYNTNISPFSLLNFLV